MGTGVPVGAVVSVTVPVSAGNGTAVATDEIAVDGLVVVTVTVEVSLGVSLLPQESPMQRRSWRTYPIHL